MRLKSLEINIEWPANVPLASLRSFVRDKLRELGEPLRWAITDISISKEIDGSRELHIEAVVIV